MKLKPKSLLTILGLAWAAAVMPSRAAAPDVCTPTSGHLKRHAGGYGWEIPAA